MSNGGLAGWFAEFPAIKQWESWQAHGKWIRATSPNFADNIRTNFESASRVTDTEHQQALADRAKLRAAMQRDPAVDSVLRLPTAWTISTLKHASADELAFNRKQDPVLNGVARLLGAPQVSIPILIEPCAAGRPRLAGQPTKGGL